MANSLDKVIDITLLLDFYGELLTDKQKQMLEMYFEEDLSLGEIAQVQDVSRQAVHDLVKRGEKILRDYEDKLGLVAKYMEQRHQLALYHQELAKAIDEENLDKIKDVNTRIGEFVDSL